MPENRFFSPRRRENALWASAVETYLRHSQPQLSLRERRNLPMMQGVYEHLRANEKGEVLPLPATPADFAALDPVMQQALLSQSFHGLATLHLTAVTGGADFYNQEFLPAILAIDDELGIRQFSTDDLAGFSSCLVLWQFYYGNGTLSAIEVELLDLLEKAIEKIFDLTPEQIQTLRAFVAAARAELPAVGVFPYRTAPAGYGALTVPANSRFILLGDWGTSMDDAEAMLEAIWASLYATASSPIIFLHLGDIYYSGLPVECQQNFYQVFARVRQSLIQRYGSHFENSAAQSKIYLIPGNHEYYSEGYGYYQLVDQLNGELGTGQLCSFFCLRSDDNRWQFLGMDTGQADHNAFEPIAEKIRNVLLPLVQAAIYRYVVFPFNIWASQWVASIVQEYTGPFAPTLKATELTWHQARIEETTAQTILLSHHQLFSGVQEIDHRTPQFINTYLKSEFGPYFFNKVAAWYWGHEHSYALYQAGLFGLNKGRLLGSSSFEVSEGTDHPYQVVYPEVPFAGFTHPNQTNGYYDHTCAVLAFEPNQGQLALVTYYGFPSWGQQDPPPSAPQLYPLTTEYITAVKAGAFTPGWSGNDTIAPDQTDKNGNYVSNPYQSKNAPTLAATPDQKDLVMVWQDSVTNQLMWATATVPDPQSGQLSWTLKGAISVKNSSGASVTLTTSAAPTLVNCGELFLLVFKGQSGQALRYATLPIKQAQWIYWGSVTYGSSNQVPQTNSAPGLTASYEGAYLAFADANNNNYLKWMVYEPSTDPTQAGSWQAPTTIKTHNGNSIAVSGPLSMTANGKTAFLAFRLDGKDAIRLAWRDMVCLTKDNPPKVTINTDKTFTILPALQVDGTTLTTTAGMAIAADEDYLYLVYTSETSNGTPNLRQAICPVPGSDSWRGNTNLKISGTYPQSQSGPGLILGKERALLVYPGAINPHLLMAFI